MLKTLGEDNFLSCNFKVKVSIKSSVFCEAPLVPNLSHGLGARVVDQDHSVRGRNTFCTGHRLAACHSTKLQPQF